MASRSYLYLSWIRPTTRPSVNGVLRDYIETGRRATLLQRCISEYFQVLSCVNLAQCYYNNNYLLVGYFTSHWLTRIFDWVCETIIVELCLWKRGEKEKAEDYMDWGKYLPNYIFLIGFRKEEFKWDWFNYEISIF